jgi:DNA polymerase I-like protein with 3'-5' exonuclease and polymerase domains
VQRDARHDVLEGLDGRLLHVRSAHAALNTLLQGAGAIVMKKALTILDEYARLWKLNYRFIGNIHDEVQSEVQPEQADKFGALAVSCLEAAGLAFDLNCPLTGEYKVSEETGQKPTKINPRTGKSFYYKDNPENCKKRAR